MSPIHHPPKLPLRLLKWYCSDDRIEELEGDLFEVYQTLKPEINLRKAQLLYWWLVIKTLRGYARKSYQIKTTNAMVHFLFMLQHHLVIASRQLWKNRMITSINVLGLAIGISAFLSIFTIIQHENSYNKHIPDAENIYRLYSRFTGTFSGANRGVSAAIPEYLKKNLPTDIAHVTGFHTRSFSASSSTHPNSPFQKIKVIVTDQEYFNVFEQYRWLEGSPNTSLTEPNKVVLTKEQAEKYLGRRATHEYLEEHIIYNDSLVTAISGIVEQVSGNTDFIFTDFISLETVNNSWLKHSIDLSNWDNSNSSSQLWLRSFDPLTDEEKNSITKILDEKSIEIDESTNWIRNFEMAPLTKMHFDQMLSIFDNRGRSSSNKELLSAMAAISIALLFLAIFNFINLEIAQTRSKMKEVGVRKVLGGQKEQIIQRFLVSSFLTTLLAGLLAIPLSYYGLLFFADYLPMSIESIILDLEFIWIISATIITVTLVSGLYPALMVSGFSPNKAFKLKNLQPSHSGPSLFLRRSFVSLQFIFSQLLIIGSIIIYLQVDLMQSKNVGFNAENILYLNNPWRTPKSNYDRLSVQLTGISEITELIHQSDPPASHNYSSSPMHSGTEEAKVTFNVHNKWGDENYLDFYNIKLLAGRSVTPSEEIGEIIINDTFRKKLGYQTPELALNQTLYNSDEPLTIIGVMEDFHYQSTAFEINPLAFTYRDSKSGVAVKFHPENMQTIVEKVTAAYQNIYPNSIVEIEFLDRTLLEFYEEEQQMSRLSTFATIIAILISCMGLFGLISLNIVQKTKEIGIRKILGANMLSIANLISKEFLFLLGFSMLISLPIVRYLAIRWLQNYAYPIELNWWIYLLGAFFSLSIALLVTSYKVVQASHTNPSESLRYE